MKSQPEVQTMNRRRELSRIRSTKRYREIVKELTTGKKCIWCGTTTHLTIHHISLDDYKSEDTYIKGLYKGWVMCHKCHTFGLHKGRILCPTCKKRYTPHERCYSCLPQSRKDEIDTYKVKFRKMLRALRRKKYLEWKEKVKKHEV